MDPFNAAAISFIAEIESLGLSVPRDQREAIAERLAIRMRAAFASAQRNNSHAVAEPIDTFNPHGSGPEPIGPREDTTATSQARDALGDA